MIRQHLSRLLKAWLSSLLRMNSERPVVWPSLAEELGEFAAELRGEVLNAGAGARDIAGLLPGRVTNQDVRADPQDPGRIVAPLHRIPRQDESFDAILCNAVLEHVRNPEEVMREFSRVLRPGGVLYLCVPFLQPEHLDPTDFQRYTLDGLIHLCERHGFQVERQGAVHSVYHTLGWIVHEWLSPRPPWRTWALRQILYPLLRAGTRRSRTQVHRIASAYRVLCRKPAGPSDTVLRAATGARTEHHPLS